MLFTTTEEIRAILPRLASSYTFADFSPFITLAEQKHIVPYIGQDFFDELTAAKPSPTTEQAAAIAKLQPAIAYYALLEAIPQLGIQIGVAGVGLGTSATTAQTTQWRENRLEESLATNAETFLDIALEFLEKNISDYSTYATSSEYAESKALFITSAKTLNAYLPIFNSRRAYIQLRPFMLEAQEETIQTTIGEDQYQDLLTKILADTLNADEKALVKRIQKPLANLTARKSFNQLAVAYQGQGFRILSSNDGIIQKQSIPLKELSGLLNEFDNKAQASLAVLKKYLQDNADAWPLYKYSEAYIPNESTQAYQMPDNSTGLSFIV